MIASLTGILRSLSIVSAAVVACMLSAPAAAVMPPQGPAGWEKTHGWTMGGGADKSAPAVLLVHGLVSSAANFRAPHTVWNIKGVDYDPKTAPALTKKVDLGMSPRPARHNYFDELGRSHKVATWTQVPCIAGGGKPSQFCLSSDTFDAAYRSAPWALRKLLDETTGPIAIVAHSRGGLVARRLLKEFGDADGRIKWFVTLHTPHAGTAVAGRPAALNDGVTKLLKILPKSLSGPAINARDAVVALTGTVGGEELAPSGARSLFPALRNGEKQVLGINYLSYGGTSTIAVRFYTKAPVVGTKSFDLFSTSALAELKNGSGDLLVTDANTRMPWPGVPHVSQPLHHAEILWHLPTMAAVRTFINTAPTKR